MRKRVKDCGIAFGRLQRGEYNSISDVPGVRVGHCTVWKDTPVVARTGVTAIFPAEGDLYESPLFAAAHVINGFGKSAGLLQIEELGQIETPILLTNTLNVGIAADALVEYTLLSHPKAGTINPVVGECNDGLLNDIQTRSVKKEDIFKALEEAHGGIIETGCVGAGTGMICYGYKGGIGTSSRIVSLANRTYTMGVLVLTNFGKKRELTIKGAGIHEYFNEEELGSGGDGRGSIIVVGGTDIPLTHRQLNRIAKRAGIGIARTGGRCSHGSGEVVLFFSNANRIPKDAQNDIRTIEMLREDKKIMDLVFDAMIDGVEEAIIDSLFTAETVKGKDGKVMHALPVERLVSEYGSLFQGC